MSRRIRVNLTRWVCRMIGHDLNWNDNSGRTPTWCDRCGRVW